MATRKNSNNAQAPMKLNDLYIAEVVRIMQLKPADFRFACLQEVRRALADYEALELPPTDARIIAIPSRKALAGRRNQTPTA